MEATDTRTCYLVQTSFGTRRSVQFFARGPPHANHVLSLFYVLPDLWRSFLVARKLPIEAHSLRTMVFIKFF